MCKTDVLYGFCGQAGVSQHNEGEKGRRNVDVVLPCSCVDMKADQLSQLLARIAVGICREHSHWSTSGYRC